MGHRISNEEYMRRIACMREMYLSETKDIDDVTKRQYEEKFLAEIAAKKKKKASFIGQFFNPDSKYYSRFMARRYSKSKMKKQMINMELKRCQRIIDNKSCSDLDKKMQAKKDLFRQKFE